MTDLCSSLEHTVWFRRIYTNIIAKLKNFVYKPILNNVEGKTPPPNECPGYVTKQSDGKVPLILELWGMRSTPLLPLLPGPLWPGVVAPDKVPIYG